MLFKLESNSTLLIWEAFHTTSPRVENQMETLLGLAQRTSSDSNNYEAIQSPEKF